MNQLIIKDLWKLFFLSSSGFWDNSYTEGDNCMFCFCHIHMLLGGEAQKDVYRLHWVASVHDDKYR